MAIVPFESQKEYKNMFMGINFLFLFLSFTFAYITVLTMYYKDNWFAKIAILIIIFAGFSYLLSWASVYLDERLAADDSNYRYTHQNKILITAILVGLGLGTFSGIKTMGN